MEEGEEGEEAPAEEEKESVLDSLSAGNSELLEKIKGMTLMQASELIKAAEKTFNIGDQEEEEEAAATEE